MRSEDFSAWLSAIVGDERGAAARRRWRRLRRQACAAEAAGRLRKGGRRGRREDALGTTGVERVERQGCPHCAGREIVGWGRSDGLLRFRCKSCGRTFNALTKTPMAHLRKKEKWLDHAQAMIEGKSLAEDRGTVRRPSDDRLPLAASVSARARRRQASNVERNCRGG